MTTLDTIATANTRELTIARGVREYVDNAPAWIDRAEQYENAWDAYYAAEDARKVTA